LVATSSVVCHLPRTAVGRRTRARRRASSRRGLPRRRRSVADRVHDREYPDRHRHLVADPSLPAPSTHRRHLPMVAPRPAQRGPARSRRGRLQRRCLRRPGALTFRGDDQGRRRRHDRDGATASGNRAVKSPCMTPSAVAARTPNLHSARSPGRAPRCGRARAAQSRGAGAAAPRTTPWCPEGRRSPDPVPRPVH
jgi:hypothetical protein